MEWLLFDKKYRSLIKIKGILEEIRYSIRNFSEYFLIPLSSSEHLHLKKAWTYNSACLLKRPSTCATNPLLNTKSSGKHNSLTNYIDVPLLSYSYAVQA